MVNAARVGDKMKSNSLLENPKVFNVIPLNLWFAEDVAQGFNPAHRVLPMPRPEQNGGWFIGALWGLSNNPGGGKAGLKP